VSRLAATLVASLAPALAITMPASATASPGGARGRAAAPATTTRPREFSGLNAVSCTGPANCLAAGFSSGPVSPKLIVRWDGTGWTQLPLPAGTVASPQVTAVACAGDSMCMVIKDGMLQEWNGTSWQLQNTSLGGLMYAVSCASAVSCVVIGGRSAFVQGQYTVLPAAVRWNGQTWTEDDPVVPPGAVTASLDGISCASASDCVAVGGSIPQAGSSALLAEQWNGQSWSVLSVPPPSVTSPNLNLASVSCAGPDSCVAVGELAVTGKDEGLAYAWDGTSWTSLPALIGVPASVSCWSASGCVTTDQNSLDSGATAIPELWNGSSWAQLHPPLPNTIYSEFDGVSCYGPSACLFVGSAGNSRPLAEFWANGQWRADRVVPRDGFAGIWCTGIVACIATGGYIDSSDNNATLTASLSGLGWQQVTTPDVSGTLTDISCDSPQFCVAVGGKGSHDLPLAEKWDGHGWGVLDTSFGNNVPGTQPIAVSCASGHCLAITSTYYGHGYAEWWNGSSWRLIKKVPTPSLHYLAQVTDVSCVSASYCLVAGARRRLNGPFTSFADLWNGTSFQLLGVPGNGLTSISCLSTTFCLGVTANSAVTWNGSSWQVRRLPGVFGRPGLTAVSCASDRLCMAVGNFVAAEGPNGNTIALLSGTTWRILPSLPPDVVLTDVSCATRSGQCVVVGERYDGASATQTFAAEWAGSEWLVYPTPSP
jgi:hypothetical protein